MDSVRGPLSSRGGFRALAFALAVGGALFVPISTAHAQAFDLPPPSKQTPSPVRQPTSSAPPTSDQTTPPTDAGSSHAGHCEVGVEIGSISNDDFHLYYPIGLRAGYWFTDAIQTEVWGSDLLSTKTDFEEFLENNFNQSLIVDVPRTLDYFVGANFIWSPLRGALRFPSADSPAFTLGAAVYLTVGVGLVQVDMRKLDLSEKHFFGGGNFGLGLRLLIDSWGSLRLEYRQHYFSDSGSAPQPVEFSGMLSFFL